MSKREKRLYILLVLVFILYVVVEQYKPEPISWEPTFAQQDRQPYGGYVLYDRLGDFFPEKELSFQTLYEHGDSLPAQFVILASQFEPTEEDLETLMGILGQGNDVLIAASYFSVTFLDTLGLHLDQEFQEATLNLGDSIQISWEDRQVYYPQNQLVGLFDLDSATEWTVVAEAKKPVAIYRPFGAGRLILSTHPLAFTNYGILKHDGMAFPERVLNLMRPHAVVYNRYYHSGRMESQTPLRYLISQPPLRWALNLTLLGILVLLIVGSRRKQAEIQLRDPKNNITIQFIKTMGGLYHREGRHAGAAQKLISHFLIALKEKYFISNLHDESTYQALAVKAGIKKAEVVQTFELIQHVKSGGSVSEQMLGELNQKIEKFNIK